MLDAARPPVVLITGASSGIGAALAARLSAHGASLVLCGRDERALRHVAASCADALPVVADVTDDDDVARLVAAAVHRFGGLDALVNNAGSAVSCRASVLNASGAMSELDANFISAVRVTAAALPTLRARGGHVVCVGSLLAVLPARAAGQRAGYAAAKAALHAWCAALAEDVKTDGVTVTLVVPGPVSTAFGARAAAAAAPDHAPPQQQQGAPGAPLPSQQPEEIAALIADVLTTPPAGGTLIYSSAAVAAAAASVGQQTA